ncbi:MAG: hypothetical protein M1821_005231 [Bathelium mastoideum]|nr:MAG: hypothetical protein M1821_005231 [Bathelium mastoideum]
MGSSSVDFQQRRDFSPSAMPPPLATRPSPASSLPENGPGTRYPPRKSSLSQQSPVQPVSAAGESSAGSGPRQMSPIAGSGPDAEESSSKPLPFIRPADIYKRIEEERQKERASTDSERPSIDSLAQAAREPRSRSSSGSFSRSAVRKPSFERNENSPFTPSRTPLEPVQERKSVFEPFETSEGPANAQTASAAETLQVDSKSIEPDASSSASAHVDTNSSRPMLPQIDPSSAFGDDIWRMTKGSEQAMPTHNALQDTNQPEQAAPVGPKNEKSSDNLQHHPSLGFRSVVNQAFDRHDDRSVPPTPVSSQDPSLSRGGSEVSRSNTDSTAGISPIMSRASSAAANTTRIQALDGRDYSTPAIAEEPDNLSLLETRRTSSGTLTAAQQIPRKPSPSHSRQASDETAKGFIPGYRRNLDPPSSENSPARTPNVEGNKQIALPEAGQLSTAMHGDELVDRPDSTKSFGRENEVYAGTSTEGLPDPNSSTERLPQSPIDRAESPSKGRVRDLAGRFNDLQSSSNRSSTDSLKLKQSNQMENSDSQVSGISNTASVFESEQSRPKIVPESRSESARPLLPGGWVSYAPSEVSVSGTGDVHNPGVAGDRIKPPINSTDAANPLIHDGDIPNMNKSGAPDLEPPNPRAAVGGDSPDKTTDPIAAVTAAGSAIAASLTQSGDPNQEATEATRENEDTQPALRHPAIGDIYVRPLAPDRNASSAATSPAPTPLPKDTPPATASKLGPDYFATPGPSNDQTTARAGAPTLLHTNTDDSLQEYESERLRKEITRQLSPEASDDLHNGNVADSRDDQPESPQSPDSDRSTTQSRQNGKGKSAGSSGVEGQPLHLAHKFSWESDGNIPDSPEELGPIQPELRAEGNRPPESLIESSGGVQETNTEKSLPYLPEPGFGQPNLSDEATRNLQSLEPVPADSESDILQQTTADSAPPIDTVQHTQHAPHPVSGGAQPSTANARIPPFREILAMKVATDRVSTYNRTRDQFANLNTGLTDWVTATLAASPEHAALTSSEARAAQPVVTTATARHRHSPSLMKLGKLPTTGHSHQQSISSNFVNDEDVMTASSPTKPVQGSTGRVTSHQVQAKGKDLLKNAGALGGKATTGAKGLFAKGRNKLQNRGSDKVDS